MAVFVYYYKTAGDERHTGEIEAGDREEAFALLRQKGIRAIKVEPKGWETGTGYKGVRKSIVALIVCLVAVVIGVVAFMLGRGVPPSDQVQTINTPQGPVSFQVAMPLERQRILGSRERIESLPTNLFSHAAEFLLARFAEPGRPFKQDEISIPVDDDVRECLRSPLRVASTDFTEMADLKRIVTGMKQEAAAYLKNGGTVEQYVGELIKRQNMEIAFREKAERRLEEMLTPQASDTPPSVRGVSLSRLSAGQLSQAYAYWLKANASLQAMGIYPLELPNVLQQYQMTLDINDEDGVPTIESKPVETTPVSIPRH